ncbi:helix-turn-helix transcriptional regulator [Pontiella sulfatireligans]|uniref:HTH-type transcriptional regulator YhjB n=1 Tax=Pontiella sulfatireligans TaxID=2750658 RepID=A0A6C2UPK9_9BACT|nr:helix-turn-helix transcriptional regulator [Pontiella sulfatireligans]VGO22240.1 Putative HTH-type transcriptional regulator YhjB [Pontiella sulfatireligans]
MGSRQITSKMISELLLELYTFPVSGDFFEHVLSVLDSRIPSSLSGCWFNDLDARILKCKTMNNHNDGMRQDRDELTTLLQSHPFMEYFYSNSAGPVLCTTDIMSEKEWKETSVYNEVNRTLGIVHDTNVRFYSGALCVSFSFSDSQAMDEGSHRLLNLVAPHLGAAYRMYNIQQKGWLSNLPDHMIPLCADGRMMDCPAWARALLDQYFPHQKWNSAWNLPEDVQRWIALEIQRAPVVEGSHKIARKLMVEARDSTLCLDLIRCAFGFLIILEEVESLGEIDVLKKLGLTQREAEVLLWVAQGKQNSDIATILNIHTPTVRKHLEHIFQKLRCETRGAAEREALQAINAQRLNCIQVKCPTGTRPICIACRETPVSS